MKPSGHSQRVSLNTHEINGDFSRVLVHDNNLAHEVAKPLFDIGVTIAGYTERINYSAEPLLSGPPYHALTLLLQGEMTFHFLDHDRRQRPGELACCPRGARHYRSAENTKSAWIYFHIEDCAMWERYKGHAAYFRSYESATLMYLLLWSLFDALGAPSREAMALARRNARALADLLTYEMVVASKIPDKRTRDLVRLVSEIRKSPSQAWTRDFMADKLNISTRQLTRLFEKEYAVSPVEMVIRQRMDHAALLLVSTHATIEAIAGDVGYSSFNSFARLFTKYIGISPGKYRTRFGHKQA